MRLTSPSAIALRGPRLVDADELRRLSAASPESVLAVVRFDQETSSLAPRWLEARIHNRLLLDGPVAELWPAAARVERFELSGVAGATDGASMFAAVSVPRITGDTLEAATFDAYDRLACAARDLGYPHFVRIWNFVPGINDRSTGLERYMSFCKGRSEAFAVHSGDAFPQGLPAASAVGCPGHTLIVHALAAREPGRPVENPRQVSAYRYPERYGPKSPAFARGTKAPPPWRGALFVSGTASIVGHESVFPGDPAAQARETLTNIETVLDAAGIAGAGAPLGARLDALRVYVRSEADLRTLREAVERFVGRVVPAIWLQAEICREELLVEIEATVLAPAP
jgi:chorismate lyase/3-hydroxybenzoate synthase